jgi:hypothetical protein
MSAARRFPVSEAIVALALLGCIVAIPLLGSQTRALRAELASKRDSAATVGQLSLTLQRNVGLSALEGRRLPVEIRERLRPAISRSVGSGGKGAVVLVYTSMSCQRALSDGIRSVQENAHLRAARLEPMVLVAEAEHADRERALLLREEGVITAQLAFADAEHIRRTLFPAADSTFDDEPLYLLVDNELNIRSAFHADQFRPELLDAWLNELDGPPHINRQISTHD